MGDEYEQLGPPGEAPPPGLGPPGAAPPPPPPPQPPQQPETKPPPAGARQSVEGVIPVHGLTKPSISMGG
ncbi:unnamed protein product [Angiostrongylus costaricensis]|uniref:WH2 domain-containing protein n=1 Tax=Angiostrongylus costaricensis TaxID=334426 RepID=A0A0R3PAE2_ANGCS|nr:unnamed protein product [Angiostrongylus costaricensis]